MELWHVHLRRPDPGSVIPSSPLQAAARNSSSSTADQPHLRGLAPFWEANYSTSQRETRLYCQPASQPASQPVARSRALDRTRKLRSSKYPFVQTSTWELFHHVSVLLFSTFSRRYSLTSADATCKREHRDDRITVRAFRVLSAGPGQKDSSIRSFVLHMGRFQKPSVYLYKQTKVGHKKKPSHGSITSSRSLF
jgi:hypothetical protein